nr:MAG TPA: hypothetical protein [Caudoviricetes sp.]
MTYCFAPVSSSIPTQTQISLAPTLPVIAASP